MFGTSWTIIHSSLGTSEQFKVVFCTHSRPTCLFNKLHVCAQHAHISPQAHWIKKIYTFDGFIWLKIEYSIYEWVLFCIAGAKTESPLVEPHVITITGHFQQEFSLNDNFRVLFLSRGAPKPSPPSSSESSPLASAWRHGKPCCHDWRHAWLSPRQSPRTAIFELNDLRRPAGPAGLSLRLRPTFAGRLLLLPRHAENILTS